MKKRISGRQLIDLAHVMVKQARLLRDEGLVSRAGELVRHAIALHRLGFSMSQPVPVRVPVTRHRRHQ